MNPIRHADIAMYKAKANGKARYEIFDSTMDLAAIRRLELEMELRRAIDRNRSRTADIAALTKLLVPSAS